VTVLFSEEEGSADAVIVRLSERFGNRAIVVTSDREVILRVRQSGAQAVGAREFMERVGARRTSASHTIRNEKPEDEDEDPRPQTKKGNPRRLSKKERARRRTLLNL
jgi:predicted RNA-binding protein with PIN domain